MFQRGVIFLLICSTLMANFTSLFLFAGFEMNRKYIASTLCENRAKPWLHCNGRCYLIKKIKLAEDKEKNEERQTQKNLFQHGFFITITEIKFSSYLLQVFPDSYRSKKPQTLSSSLLRPPQFAS